MLPKPQVLYRFGQGGSLKKDYIQIIHHIYTLGKKVCYSAKNPKANGQMPSRFGTQC